MEKKSGKQQEYTPHRGDLVWIELDPTRGSEIQKTRPAVVISPYSYNKIVGLALMCPITSKQKGYPFEVSLNSKQKVKGVILADQVRSMDWRVRKAKLVERLPADIIKEVIDKVSALLEET